MRRVLLAVTAVLILGLVVPGSATSAMQKGKPKGDKEPQLIIVFRDDPGDLVRSDDGGAYIGGEEGIDRAEFDRAGEVRFSTHFSQPKGKKNAPTDSRSLRINLHPDVRDVTADLPTDGLAPFYGEQSVSVSFHSSVGPGDVQGLCCEGNWSWTGFPIFGATGSVLEGWKLSYSDRRLRDGTEGGGLATVTCVSATSGDCIAWRIDKTTNKPEREKNRAALVGGGTSEEPDAGEWILPFAVAVCLRDAPMFGYDGTNGDAVGAACKALVF